MERPGAAIVPAARRAGKGGDQKRLGQQIFAMKTSASANFCGGLGVTGPAKSAQQEHAEECHGSSPFRQLRLIRQGRKGRGRAQRRKCGPHSRERARRVPVTTAHDDESSPAATSIPVGTLAVGWSSNVIDTYWAVKLV